MVTVKAVAIVVAVVDTYCCDDGDDDDDDDVAMAPANGDDDVDDLVNVDNTGEHNVELDELINDFLYEAFLIITMNQIDIDIIHGATNSIAK